MKKKNLLWAVVVLVVVFSLVSISCSEDSKDPPFTLTVNNYPNLAPGKLIGASLLANTKTDPQPVAVGGMPNFNGTTATYTFYHPQSPTNPVPDTNRPFTTPGSYFPALAEITITNPTGDRIIHDYKGMNKFEFNASVYNHTVDFDSEFSIRP